MRRRQFLGFFGLFLAGCTGARVSQTTANPPLPAVIRFSVTDEIGLEPLEAKFSELRLALAAALETDVEFVAVEDQTAAAVLIQSGEIDLALAGPAEYVMIRTRTNAVPVVGITRPDYRSLLATKAGSSIASVTDLKGKTIALSDIGSTSGHLGPVAMIITAGLNPQTDVTLQMLGDEGSVAAMQQGTVDAWGGSATDYQDLIDGDPAAFPLIEQGPLLPNDMLMASSRLRPEWVTLIKERLLAHEDALIEAIALHHAKYIDSTLTTIEDADYDPIRDAYRAIGQGEFLQ